MGRYLKEIFVRTDVRYAGTRLPVDIIHNPRHGDACAVHKTVGWMNMKIPLAHESRLALHGIRIQTGRDLPIVESRIAGALETHVVASARAVEAVVVARERPA